MQTCARNCGTDGCCWGIVCRFSGCRPMLGWMGLNLQQAAKVAKISHEQVLTQGSHGHLVGIANMVGDDCMPVTWGYTVAKYPRRFIPSGSTLFVQATPMSKQH